MQNFKRVGIISFIWACLIINANSQTNTIGLLQIDSSLVSDGFILLNPESQSTVFLINNCGEIVHSWATDNVRFPGKDQYLDDEGRLYLASIQPAIQGPSFGAGGAGGVIEILDWDGTVEWQHVVADNLQRQHHDIHIMPNGNVMFIAWENITLDQAAEYGFDTLNNPQIGFWPDKIVEINPNNNEIVWEWKSFDHMVQDIDTSILNYGIISDHPELININYIDFAFGRQDIHHVNSVDYNEELDMILISVRNFNEVWIIDHSTSIEEAASHEGGLRGKGGDLLYRWGNPAAYNSGNETDQNLFRQHDASWVDDVPSDHPYFGQVSVYNNFIGPELSLGAIFNPIFDEDENSFNVEDGLFLPLDFTSTISHPNQEKNFSTAASNLQVLPNGNTLMCAGRQGRIFELTSSGNPVWEYLVPMRNGFPISQGDELSLSENFTFTARRYPSDFSGFQGRELSPKGYIELAPNLEYCELSVVVEDNEIGIFTAFPNPINDILTITLDHKAQINILDILGNKVGTYNLEQGGSIISVEHLISGFYFLQNTYSKDKIKIVKL